HHADTKSEFLPGSFLTYQSSKNQWLKKSKKRRENKNLFGLFDLAVRNLQTGYTQGLRLVHGQVLCLAASIRGGGKRRCDSRLVINTCFFYGRPQKNLVAVHEMVPQLRPPG
ncbi:MAG: hypothetical protein LBK44_01810, partial [Spirochaetales bacterium]|nr:hypothetical protein [Spirochaetales bacterium]